MCFARALTSVVLCAHTHECSCREGPAGPTRCCVCALHPRPPAPARRGGARGGAGGVRLGGMEGAGGVRRGKMGRQRARQQGSKGTRREGTLMARLKQARTTASNGRECRARTCRHPPPLQLLPPALGPCASEANLTTRLPPTHSHGVDRTRSTLHRLHGRDQTAVGCHATLDRAKITEKITRLNAGGIRYLCSQGVRSR